MRSYNYFLPLEPVPLLRPKIFKNRMYNHKRVTDFKKRVKEFVRHDYKDELMTGAIEISLDFVLSKPKSVKRKYPTVKPDIDNFTKCILDALNNIVYKDDAQIIKLQATKSYGLLYGVMIKVKEI